MNRNRNRNEDNATYTALGVVAWGLLFAIAMAALILAALAYNNSTNGLQGPPGTNGTCNSNCSNTTTTTTGVAQFIRTIQSPNDSNPPGVALTIDTTVYNNVPVDIVYSAGAGGSVFTLSAGVYVVDYEMSLSSAGSVGLYVGATAGSLALDSSSVCGSSTATTWVNCKSVQNVPTTLVVAVSSVVGTLAVVTAGNAGGVYMVRLTITKLS